MRDGVRCNRATPLGFHQNSFSIWQTKPTGLSFLFIERGMLDIETDLDRWLSVGKYSPQTWSNSICIFSCTSWLRIRWIMANPMYQFENAWNAYFCMGHIIFTNRSTCRFSPCTEQIRYRRDKLIVYQQLITLSTVLRVFIYLHDLLVNVVKGFSAFCFFISLR